MKPELRKEGSTEGDLSPSSVAVTENRTLVVEQQETHGSGAPGAGVCLTYGEGIMAGSRRKYNERQTLKASCSEVLAGSVSELG